MRASLKGPITEIISGTDYKLSQDTPIWKILSSGKFMVELIKLNHYVEVLTSLMKMAGDAKKGSTASIEII